MTPDDTLRGARFLVSDLFAVLRRHLLPPFPSLPSPEGFPLMLVDLHAKSSLSPASSPDPRPILQRLQGLGFDGIAFVESSRTSHLSDIVAVGQEIGIHVFGGVEIATDRGILLCFPPSLDDPFIRQEEWRQATELTTPAADYVIEMFRDQGGVVVASRPYDLEIPYNMGDWIFRIRGIHAVEVFNPHVGQIQSDFALEAALALALPTFGGSDSSSLDDFGLYGTFFKHDFSTQAQLVEQLKGKEYWSVYLGDVDLERSSRSPVSDDSTDSRSQRSVRSNERNDKGDRGDRRHSRSSGNARSSGGRRRPHVARRSGPPRRNK